MSPRSSHQRAQDEALAMAVRDQRNDRCVLDGWHNPHLLQVRCGGSGQPFRVAPCGGGANPVDKEADRGWWDQLGS